MAASDLASKANEAFVDEDSELAAELYTKAIDAGPATADLHADRAQAHIKLGNYAEAVADANKAIELDPAMNKAYSRKSAACIKLEEYKTALEQRSSYASGKIAKAALEQGSSYASDDSRFTRLLKKWEKHIAADDASQVPIKNLYKAAPAASVAATVVDKEHSANVENTQTMVKKPKYRPDNLLSPAIAEPHLRQSTAMAASVGTAEVPDDLVSALVKPLEALENQVNLMKLNKLSAEEGASLAHEALISQLEDFSKLVKTAMANVTKYCDCRSIPNAIFTGKEDKEDSDIGQELEVEPHAITDDNPSNDLDEKISTFLRGEVESGSSLPSDSSGGTSKHKRELHERILDFLRK